MNTYQININSTIDNEDMVIIANALAEAGIIGEDIDGIGVYLQDGFSRALFVQIGQVSEAVAVINGLGFETDEDDTTYQINSTELGFETSFTITIDREPANEKEWTFVNQVINDNSPLTSDEISHGYTNDFYVNLPEIETEE